MSEIDLKSFEEEVIQKRFEITAILENIHGEYAERTQEISGVVFDVTDKVTEGEKEEETKEAETKRKMKRSRPATVHTFPRDEEGNLLVPLGGKWGYIMGALKVAVQDLYKDQLKNKNWEGYGIRSWLVHGVHVAPEWVSVGKQFSNPKEKPKTHMVVTSGMTRAMVPVYYDVVDKTNVKFNIEITNKKVPEKILLQMLSYIQRLSLGPKGRGILLITRVTKTKGD